MCLAQVLAEIGRIVRREDRHIGPCGDAPHSRALRKIPFPRHADEEDQTLCDEGFDRIDDLVERVRRMGEIDDDVDRQGTRWAAAIHL